KKLLMAVKTIMVSTMAAISPLRRRRKIPRRTFSRAAERLPRSRLASLAGTAPASASRSGPVAISHSMLPTPCSRPVRPLARRRLRRRPGHFRKLAGQVLDAPRRSHLEGVGQMSSTHHPHSLAEVKHLGHLGAKGEHGVAFPGELAKLVVDLGLGAEVDSSGWF